MRACAKTVGVFAALVMTFGLGALACSGADDASVDGSGGGDGSSGGPSAVAAAKSTDGVKSGDETDVDCGGSSPKKCAVGQSCNSGGDCETASCKAGKCVAPAPDDGAKNGDETDVDCGGTKAPKCAAGKGCATNDDCATDACGADKKCVEFRSCTGTAGATTCGEAGKGESCCSMIPVQAGAASFKIDKFQATAGRMRAFVERTKGDLKGWVTTAKPKGWQDAWTDELPSNMDEALVALGPDGKQGCNIEFEGARTYWQDAIDGNAKEKSDFPQDVLDAKSLNCVTWHMAAALCAFDGKRLAKSSEISAVFKNGGTTTYPWQFADKTAYSSTQADDRLCHVYNYETPNPPANMRLVNNQYPLDHAFYISEPGRFPKGANKDGVQDIAGNMMPWVSDGVKKFAWTFSWENHKGDVTTSTYSPTNGAQAYYAIGIRCASE